MKPKILFVLCLLTGLMFINAGLNKFFFYIPMPDDLSEAEINMFNAMMQMRWLMPLLAVFEIIGGILLVIPKTRALGAVILTPIMSGILAHHFTLGTGLVMPIVLAAILAWIIIENRGKYLKMLTQ